MPEDQNPRFKASVKPGLPHRSTDAERSDPIRTQHHADCTNSATIHATIRPIRQSKPRTQTHPTPSQRQRPTKPWPPQTSQLHTTVTALRREARPRRRPPPLLSSSGHPTGARSDWRHSGCPPIGSARPNARRTVGGFCMSTQVASRACGGPGWRRRSRLWREAALGLCLWMRDVSAVGGLHGCCAARRWGGRDAPVREPVGGHVAGGHRMAIG